METSIYVINKGVNRCVEFKGLKAQWIWILAGGIVALLLLFTIIYLVGVNMYLCLLIVFSAGGFLFKTVYRLSNTYGEHGLMKKYAQRRIPTLIKCNSRRLFYAKSVR